MSNRKTPVNIEYGTQVLKLPALRDLGLDEKITTEGKVETKVEIGDWVERNQELVKVTYYYYQNEEKPRWFFNSDKLEHFEVTLNSPINGLVIGFRRDYLVDSPGEYLYGPQHTFPILLVPKREPLLNRDISEPFYHYLRESLLAIWERIWFYDKGTDGYARLGQIYPEIQSSNTAESPDLSLNTVNIFDLLDKNERTSWGTETELSANVIEYLRANDLDLRDKLFHIVEHNYDE